MKHPRLLLAGLCMLVQLTSTAQKLNVKWGDNAKLKYDFDDAVPLADSKYMILKLEAKQTGRLFGGPSVEYDPSIVLVGPDMEQLSEKKLSIEEKMSNLRGFEKYGNNIYLMYTAYDKETKTTSFY